MWNTNCIKVKSFWFEDGILQQWRFTVGIMVSLSDSVTAYRVQPLGSGCKFWLQLLSYIISPSHLWALLEMLLCICPCVCSCRVSFSLFQCEWLWGEYFSSCRGGRHYQTGFQTLPDCLCPSGFLTWDPDCPVQGSKMSQDVIGHWLLAGEWHQILTVCVTATLYSGTRDLGDRWMYRWFYNSY